MYENMSSPARRLAIAGYLCHICNTTRRSGRVLWQTFSSRQTGIFEKVSVGLYFLKKHRPFLVYKSYADAIRTLFRYFLTIWYLARKTQKCSETSSIHPRSSKLYNPYDKSHVRREGVVEFIDSMDQIHGTWGGLALIPGEDDFIVIKRAES